MVKFIAHALTLVSAKEKSGEHEVTELGSEITLWMDMQVQSLKHVLITCSTHQSSHAHMHAQHRFPVQIIGQGVGMQQGILYNYIRRHCSWTVLHVPNHSHS